MNSARMIEEVVRRQRRQRRGLGRRMRWGLEGSIIGGGGGSEGSNAWHLAFDRRIKVGTFC